MTSAQLTVLRYEFCEQEYGSKADFSDMSSINIAYTSILEIDNTPISDELELQVSADLKNYAINSYINGDLIHSQSGNFTRLDNLLNGMEERLKGVEIQLERLKNELSEAQTQLDVPFPHEQELKEKSKRLDELTKQLESAADEKQPSELVEIVDPYFIEVSSEEAAEKLKSSGITHELRESEGHYILKLNRSDKDKVHDLLEQQKKIVL